MNFPTMSRKDKKYARRDREFYPPRIVLTTSEIEQVPTRSSASPLHVKVTGIADQSSVCQGFNLPILRRIKRGMVLHIIHFNRYILIIPVVHSEMDPSTVPSAVDSTDPPGGPGKLLVIIILLLLE